MSSAYRPPQSSGTVNQQTSLTWASLIILSVLVTVGLVFLAIAFFANKDIVARRTAVVVFEGALVRPGPGDLSPAVYCEGSITFHLTDHTIYWRFDRDATTLGTVTSIDIFGPTLATDPLSGPVFLTLCGPPTTVPCLLPSPNTLEQTIIQTSPLGQPLINFIEAITSDRARYKIRIKTQNFPAGALVGRLNAGF